MRHILSQNNNKNTGFNCNFQQQISGHFAKTITILLKDEKGGKKLGLMFSHSSSRSINKNQVSTSAMFHHWMDVSCKQTCKTRVS